MIATQRAIASSVHARAHGVLVPATKLSVPPVLSLRHSRPAVEARFTSHSSDMSESEALDMASKTLTIKSDEVSPVVQAVLLKAFQAYAVSTPSVLGVVRSVISKHFLLGTPIWHDHYAFRTFGVPGLGIQSLQGALEQLGYERQPDDFAFPGKKLQATWFAPRNKGLYELGLPRIFVSEIEVKGLQEVAFSLGRLLSTDNSIVNQVPKLSPKSQAIIHHYTAAISDLPPAMALGAMLTRTLPWSTPSLAHYKTLLQESEYAAWTLAHGYALNHSTISIHRLGKPASSDVAEAVAEMPFGVAEFTELVRAEGFPLNQEGGLLKVSPDGLLLQSSTVSDRVRYSFADGAVQEIAGSYVEFAERKALKEGPSPVSELDRREGFEVGNADNIFASTNVKS